MLLWIYNFTDSSDGEHLYEPLSHATTTQNDRFEEDEDSFDSESESEKSFVHIQNTKSVSVFTVSFKTKMFSYILEHKLINVRYFSIERCFIHVICYTYILVQYPCFF